MSVGVGDGTTVTFATSSWSAQVVSVDGPDVTRSEIDSTHIGSTTAKSYLMSNLYDGGTLTLNVHHDPALTVPIGGAFETCTIDWGGSGSTWVFSAACSGYTPGAALDEMMEATMTWKVTGAITGI